MSLLDIAKSIKKEGFDLRKDSANGPAPIPAGTYPVVLKKATFNVSDKGWESLGYQFEIRGGDYSGRSEFATFGTLTEWNGKNLDWAVERTMKFFIKALEEALKRKAVGSYYNLVISVTKGKDGREFRNYDLEEEEAQPLTEADIDDDDLPF